MDNDDLELVLACRRGDQLAWTTLVRRYQRLIYAIPLRAGLTQDEAAEIFQDVFTTFFEKLHDINEPEKLQAWLVTTARRKTLRAVSKFQRRPETELDEQAREAGDIRDETPLPDEQLLVLEEQHRLRMAISLLNERCRTLLQLLFYVPEPPSYADIAARLGMTEGSIGPTRARCLAKLLQLMKK